MRGSVMDGSSERMRRTGGAIIFLALRQ